MESIVSDALRSLGSAFFAAADGQTSASIAYWLLLIVFTAAYLWSEHKPPPASSASRFCYRLPFLLLGAVALVLGRADHDLFVFLAELLVAWVIYREFEASRRERSLAAIDSPALVTTRARIYHEFSNFMATRMSPIGTRDSHTSVNLRENYAGVREPLRVRTHRRRVRTRPRSEPGGEVPAKLAETLDGKSAPLEPSTDDASHQQPARSESVAHVVCADDVAAFAKHLYSRDELWKEAEEVIRSLERASFIGLDWLPAEWFPHGATLSGILLQDYVKNRQQDRGTEWGKRFLLVVRKAAKKQKDWPHPVKMKDRLFDFNFAKKRLADAK